MAVVADTASGAGRAGRAGSRAAHPWQTRIGLTALVLPLPCALAVAVDGGPVFLLVVPALLLGVPLILRGNRAWFMTSCVVAAVLVLGWSVMGVLEGTWMYLPSTPLLICANFADPRAYRTPATIATALACLISVPCALLAYTAAMTLMKP
ncbi:hypothetical protein AB0B01_29355 [Streptomyces sp. NPDC044571]|uniref:hypothetical protein n=1 Tax=Streptomyces sp. NPDC044571 TaxID=3155371 RepID=UPI0033E10FCE